MWSACLDEYQHAVGRHYDLFLLGRNARGAGVHPRNAFVDIQTLCLQNTSIPKTMTNKPDTRTNSYMLQSESLLIHPKILTRKSESVLIHFVQINGNPLFIKKSTRISQDSAQGYRKS